MKLSRFALGLALASAALSPSAHSQPTRSPDRTATPAQAESSRVKTVQLDSRLMGRKMPYRVVLPAGYESKAAGGRRYPVIYLLHGLSGHYDNWTTMAKVADHSIGIDAIIVTPEGENGWYTDNRAKDGQNYESYLVTELFPAIARSYRTLEQRDKRAIAGLSMGGYGAIKFGLKYPDKFALAGSFSGAVGAASLTESDVPGTIGRSIVEIFGPAGSESRKANDVFDIVRRASREQIRSFPFLYLDCGTEDFLFTNNRQFVDILVEKGVPHEWRQLPGTHSWKYWDKQVQEFLRIADRTFTNAPDPARK